MGNLKYKITRALPYLAISTKVSTPVFPCVWTNLWSPMLATRPLPHLLASSHSLFVVIPNSLGWSITHLDLFLPDSPLHGAKQSVFLPYLSGWSFFCLLFKVFIVIHWPTAHSYLGVFRASYRPALKCYLVIFRDPHTPALHWSPRRLNGCNNGYPLWQSAGWPPDCHPILRCLRGPQGHGSVNGVGGYA